MKRVVILWLGLLLELTGAYALLAGQGVRVAQSEHAGLRALLIHSRKKDSRSYYSLAGYQITRICAEGSGSLEIVAGDSDGVWAPTEYCQIAVGQDGTLLRLQPQPKQQLKRQRVPVAYTLQLCSKTCTQLQEITTNLITRLRIPLVVAALSLRTKDFGIFTAEHAICVQSQLCLSASGSSAISVPFLEAREVVFEYWRSIQEASVPCIAEYRGKFSPSDIQLRDWKLCIEEVAGHDAVSYALDHPLQGSLLMYATQNIPLTVQYCSAYTAFYPKNVPPKHE